MPAIRSVTAREVLDALAVPTVEADVILTDGSRGRASAAGGISRGPFAVELRDGGARFAGMGVLTAVRQVIETIAPALVGHEAHDQRGLDGVLGDLDGTRDRSKLGANAMLAVSCAVARAAAASVRQPLHVLLAASRAPTLPVPQMNVLSGRGPGALADVREFMVMPHGAASFRQALTWCAEIHRCLRSLVRARGWDTAVDDEGAFTPPVTGNDAAFELMVEAIEAAGLAPGREVGVSVDIGPVRRPDGLYDLGGTTHDVESVASLYGEWQQRYPLLLIEDPLDAEDWAGWTSLTAALGSRLQLTGDGLFAGRADRLRKGATERAANAVLIKPGQIGTLTETLDTMALAGTAGYRCTVSHRTGETDDPLIAQLAVATGCGQIKSGAPVRGERVAKYNELLRIEEELGPDARYGSRLSDPSDGVTRHTETA